ncbi:MAG: signal peptidase I [Thalassobaculales bacterium]
MAINGTGPASARKAGGWLETVKTIVYAVLIALGIRTIAFEPFNIPSGSMIPTLLVGDYLFVSKYSYGYSRHSLPFSLPLIPGRVLFREPARGDVVVFKLPRDNSTDYIKRLVGLPGDRLQMRAGVLHINGQPVQRRLIGDYISPDDGRERARAFIETLPGGRSHQIIEETDSGPLDNTPEYVVPAGHYFAMGDNRDSSFDSRVIAGVGYVPKENLVGRAEFLFFSTNGQARLWEVWKWPWAVRWDRLFQGIN